MLGKKKGLPQKKESMHPETKRPKRLTEMPALPKK
jgi:hypothetical protein